MPKASDLKKNEKSGQKVLNKYNKKTKKRKEAEK